MSRLSASILVGLTMTHPLAAADAPPPTAAEAKAFVEEAEAKLLDLGISQQRAAWVQAAATRALRIIFCSLSR